MKMVCIVSFSVLFLGCSKPLPRNPEAGVSKSAEKSFVDTVFTEERTNVSTPSLVYAAEDAVAFCGVPFSLNAEPEEMHAEREKVRTLFQEWKQQHPEWNATVTVEIVENMKSAQTGMTKKQMRILSILTPVRQPVSADRLEVKIKSSPE